MKSSEAPWEEVVAHRQARERHRRLPRRPKSTLIAKRASDKLVEYKAFRSHTAGKTT